MGHQTDINSKQLAKILQKIQPHYAYRMIMLEVSLHSESKNIKTQNSTQTDQITSLTQLYMKAVQVLQDAYRPGFEYFNWKIKNLLQKRSVIEQLMKQAKTTQKQRASTMQAIEQAQLKQKRQQHDLKMTLVESPSKNRQKVKDMIKNAEMRLNMIQSKIKTGIVQQQVTLNKRIKLRRLKSQSSTRDPFQRNQYFDDKKLPQQINTQEQQDTKRIRQMTGLNKKGRNRHLFSSFTNLK